MKITTFIIEKNPWKHHKEKYGVLVGLITSEPWQELQEQTFPNL